MVPIRNTRSSVEKKINVKMIDQGSSELKIIVGVKNIHFNDAIRAIYNTFIEQE